MSPSSPRKRRRLKSVANVRIFVADVLRQLEAEALEIDRARVMLYGAQILSSIIKDSEFEQRIVALEEAAHEPPANQRPRAV
jgi:hypothetical protein